MPTFTPNYNLAKPLVNSAVDQDLWGNELNGDMDIIDTTLASLQAQITALTSTQLPIGSLYWNLSDSTNPGTLLGYGTWTAITDKFMVARGSTYTGTGGAASVTIGASNLPSFDIAGNYWNNASAPAGQHLSDTSRVSGGADSTLSPRVNITLSGAVNAGSPNTAISTIPPYQAAYCWQRIS
jgi:hypothetical protein